MAIEPFRISSLPSPSMSPTLMLCCPWPWYLNGARSLVHRHSLLQLAILQRPGVDAHHAVGAAHDDQARRLAIEIGDAEHVPARSVAAVVGPLGRLAALDPRRAVDLLAGGAVVDDERLGPVEDEALAAVERLGLRRRVGRAAHRDFRLAVAVEIAHHHRREPDAVVDVPAEIDAPQEAAGPAVVGVELVGVGARHATRPGSMLPAGCLTTKS